MKIFIFGLLLVLVLELRGAKSTVYKNVVYKALRLTENEINVDIRSAIPGRIRWIYTNETLLTLSINLTAESRELLNEVSIFYQSNSSACVLHIDTFNIQSEAVVTGAGSKSYHVLFLIWFSLVIVEWRHIYLLLILLFADGVVHSMAMKINPDIPARSVDIEIQAPIRFQYKEQSLMMDGGRIRISHPELQEVPPLIKCISELTDYSGCESCCHGNGYCFQNLCHCDPGYDLRSNCSLKLREDILFNHPLDPRLTRSVLPSGEVVTLSYVSNDKKKLGRVKNPDLVYLDTISDLNSSTVYFYSDGMIKKINLYVQNQTYTMQIKRTKDTQCQGTLILSSNTSGRLSKKIDICGITKGVQSKRNEKESNELKSSVKRYSNKRRHSNRHGRINKDGTGYRQKKDSDSKRRLYDVQLTSYKRRSLSGNLSPNFVDIPVTAMRCASDHALDYNVMFEMMTQNENSNKNVGFDQETVYLSTKLNTKYHRTQRYLQLPRSREILVNVSKCNKISHIRNKICNKEMLDIHKQICDFIYMQQSSNATESMLSFLKRHCAFVMNILHYFCDNHQMTNDNYLTDCMPFYSHSVDLFSSPNYFLRPIVTFTDGKKIIGSWREITMQTILGLQKTGIVIPDNKPEVKIVKVSVIPNDPVPQDIYQVRLEYTCATNQTVIRMNVTGSDQYRNHVTCKGVTECSCCILHAAGAKDAVVDHVTINITDSLSGINTIKQMVVIF